MSRLTRDGTAEPVSQDQILRCERGQRNLIVPVQLTAIRISNLARLIHIDLTAIQYLYYMPRGYQSRHRDTYEIMISVLYLCFGVSRLATILHYTELRTRDSMRMD